MLLLFVLGVGVFVMGIIFFGLADRVRALEHRVADSSKRLLSSEGEVARLRELVNAWQDSPAPPTTTRSAEQPVPATSPVEEAPPTGPEPSALPEQTRDATAPAMPSQPVPFKPPPRPASIPVAAWAPPAWVEAAASRVSSRPAICIDIVTTTRSSTGSSSSTGFRNSRSPRSDGGCSGWFGAGVGEISRHLSSFDQQSATLGFVTASVATIAFLRGRLDWKHLAYPPFLLLPAMLVLTFTWFFTASHPLAHWGVLAWPATFLAQYWVLWRLDADWKREAPLYHCGTLWLGVFLMTWEGAWIIEQLVPDGPTWSFLVWALVPLAVIVGLTTVGVSIEWPLRRHRKSYLGGGQLPLAIAVAGWVLVASFHPGDPHPLGYVPVLNPLELVQILAVGGLLWWSSASSFGVIGDERWGGLGVLAFMTLNGIIARATHFLGNVPFRGSDLWSAAVFQTSLSIVWTAVAFVIMFGATRLKLRSHWWVGAVLLAAVVTKLFSVDLADIGTIARIVSFVVVGGLILVIGYVSPLPPKEQAESSA